MSKTLDIMDLEREFEKLEQTEIQDYTQDFSYEQDETCGCGSVIVHDSDGFPYCPDCGLD